VVSSSFKQIPISELRIKLPKLRRQVQLGQQRIVVSCYGEVVGFLLPLDDVNPENGVPIDRWEEMPLTKFRDQLTESWELLQSGVDCIYLTFHTRRVVVFVSPNLSLYLPLPMIGNADKIFFFPDTDKYQLQGDVKNVQI
jgi:hypothetical protein